MKLQDLTESIVVTSENQQEWENVQSIFKDGGYTLIMGKLDNVYNAPSATILNQRKEYINLSGVADILTNVLASDFISSNTPLSDTTTNDNPCETFSANC